MNDDGAKRSSSGRGLAGRAAVLRSLLVPIDLTPSSDRVLGRVSLLPLADDAVVTIFHVVPGSLSARQQQAAVRDAKRALAVEARHLIEALPKGISINPIVLGGTAVKEIAACASKVKAELIVMGRGGGRALRDAFLGSTAERVIRKAQLPVLVVRLAPRMAYRQPALAIDIDDQAAHDVIRHILLLFTSTTSSRCGDPRLRGFPCGSCSFRHTSGTYLEIEPAGSLGLVEHAVDF